MRLVLIWMQSNGREKCAPLYCLYSMSHSTVLFLCFLSFSRSPSAALRIRCTQFVHSKQQNNHQQQQKRRSTNKNALWKTQRGKKDHSRSLTTANWAYRQALMHSKSIYICGISYSILHFIISCSIYLIRALAHSHTRTRSHMHLAKLRALVNRASHQLYAIFWNITSCYRTAITNCTYMWMRLLPAYVNLRVFTCVAMSVCCKCEYSGTRTWCMQ